MEHKKELKKLISDFREWLSLNYSKKDIAENMCDDAGYPDWNNIEDYFSQLLANKELQHLDKEDKINLLYLIARNWDIGSMISWLNKEQTISNLGQLDVEDFIDLAYILSELSSPEFDDAKIQFIAIIKKFDLTPETEKLLLILKNNMSSI